jgi:hypothetical protein
MATQTLEISIAPFEVGSATEEDRFKLQAAGLLSTLVQFSQYLKTPLPELLKAVRKKRHRLELEPKETSELADGSYLRATPPP